MSNSLHQGIFGKACPGSGPPLCPHAPFRRKMCRYRARNMRLVARCDPVAAYVERLIADIRLAAGALGHRHTPRHIRRGGGAPMPWLCWRGDMLAFSA